MTRNTTAIEPTARYEGKYIGGRGIDARLLYDSVGPETDALDPENLLVFSAGPFTGTLVPGSGRTHVRAKSPVTGLCGASAFGGDWGPEVKYAGYDHIVLEGKADRPTYIYIDNETVRIKDACNCWGKDTWETQSAIREELRDPDAKIVCIGPAGENLVRYATVSSGLDNTAGRTGMGAVMGSKNLKAIAVRGTNGVKVAEPEKFFELCAKAHRILKESPVYEEASQRGMTADVDNLPLGGLAAFNNWQKGTHPQFEQMRIGDFFNDYLLRRQGCFGCNIGCNENYVVPGLGAAVIKCAQYMTFCFSVGNADLDLWFEATVLCQKVGIDVLQAAGILSWLMELYQRGIITEKDTDGIPMEWGNRSAILDIIRKISRREGIGDLLTENFSTIARKMGKGSEDYFIHTKGLALEIIDLRAMKGSALAGAIGPRGEITRGNPVTENLYPVIMRSEAEEIKQLKEYMENISRKISGTEKGWIPSEYEGKAAYVIYTENEVALIDMLGFCKWVGPQGLMALDAAYAAELYTAGKGVQVSSETLYEAAERTRNLERAFEIREGITRYDDKLPKRFFEPITDGASKGEKIDPVKLEEMKTEYYMLRGWNPETGVPKRETLEKLGLKEVADDMDKVEKRKRKKKNRKGGT